jgi:hypothetical protein
MKIIPHRLDPYVRKMNRAIQGENQQQAIKSLQIFLEKGVKVDPNVEDKTTESSRVKA